MNRATPPPPFGILGRIFLEKADERLYAVVRIGFALVALYNLLLLWPMREALFSTIGTQDLEAAVERSGMASVVLFHLFQTPTQVTVLMSIVGVLLMLLAAGIVPRLAAAGVFLWHLSYFERAPMALTGWDMVLRSFSFLVLVSPLGNCWTLPVLWRQKVKAIVIEPAQAARYGLVLMRLQVAVIYLQTVVAKWVNVNPYWRHGEFMPYFLMSHNARWPGTWPAGHTEFLMLCTYLALAVELAIPILLCIKRTRWWGALLGLLLHGFISVVARNIEPFFLVMMMSYLAFLSAEDLDQLQSRFAKKPASATAAPKR